MICEVSSAIYFPHTGIPRGLCLDKRGYCPQSRSTTKRQWQSSSEQRKLSMKHVSVIKLSHLIFLLYQAIIRRSYCCTQRQYDRPLAQYKVKIYCRQDTFKALHSTSTRGLPKDWRRRPGRPRHTWLRTLNADLHPLNHRLNSAWRLAQDRERWRKLVETATLQPGAIARDDDDDDDEDLHKTPT